MSLTLPSELLSSLAGVKGFDPETFEKVHTNGGQVTSIRFNPAKWKGSTDQPTERVPWSSFGYYLPQRPSFTFDPLFHAGVYYVQEASSMFLEQALRQTTDLTRPLRVLDLCAAPGGKSTLIQSLLSVDSLLVSNEVIRSRVSILQENMVKWGAANVIVTQNDPRDFQRLENYFDIIVVDAPCSGSGLFRREPEAIAEWSPANVELCQQRQQRILADCWPALRKDGLLIYSTCSYSRQEDEDILDWLMKDLQAASCQLRVEESWGIVETCGKKGGWGYRFYPDKLKGEGLFLSVLRKEEGGNFIAPRSKKPALEKLSRREQEEIDRWTNKEIPLFYFRHQEQIGCLPASLSEDLSWLHAHCYLKKAGILMGQAGAKEFIPEHELALSTLMGKEIPGMTLSREEAISYLRKDEIPLPAGTSGRGWTLVQYEGHSLGWVKILPNRVNNYYPKEWRILKRES